MLLMDYKYISGKKIPDYAKKAKWNLFHAYIYAHSYRLIDEFPGYGVQAISILQYQCENITFYNQSRYNRMFSQVVHKEG